MYWLMEILLVTLKYVLEFRLTDAGINYSCYINIWSCVCPMGNWWQCVWQRWRLADRAEYCRDVISFMVLYIPTSDYLRLPLWSAHLPLMGATCSSVHRAVVSNPRVSGWTPGFSWIHVEVSSDKTPTPHSIAVIYCSCPDNNYY